ncbi:acid-sensing ion channel 2-like [Pangasianodon hypophthalmus]|uniref:acid-sensing ion channel 2-like n=1 Tax=Pangasianodon hypophthalmus TaxID=310915 RepID=UPI0023075438|nr:acid-sensing ion channel 2-like [Pangasianodon hypophthalmus]
MVRLTMTQEPINNGSKPQKAYFQRKSSITKITLAFVFRTKVHGLRYVFAPDKSKPQRFFWLLAICICLVLLFVWSCNRLFYLLSFPAVTKIYMVWAKSMTFPAVTLCNQNLFRVSSLTKADLYHSGYWMDIMHANHSVNRQSVAMLKHSRHREKLMRLLDFSDYVPPPRFHLNTTEIIDRLSHQLEDMLLECKFRGESCTHKNFTTVCILFHECHFISYSNNLKILIVLLEKVQALTPPLHNASYVFEISYIRNNTPCVVQL